MVASHLVCGLCGLQMSYTHSPGKFTSYLQRIHQKELDTKDVCPKSKNDNVNNHATENIAKTEQVKEDKILHWKGEQLFPPHFKRPMQSRIWKFTGFRRNSKGQLITAETVCALCGLERTFSNSSYGPQLHHLQKIHKKIVLF